MLARSHLGFGVGISSVALEIEGFVAGIKEWFISITLDWSLALIGSASARVVVEQHRARAEALSIRRLEGRRWQGGRLWSHKLVWIRPE